MGTGTVEVMAVAGTLFVWYSLRRLNNIGDSLQRIIDGGGREKEARLITPNDATAHEIYTHILQVCEFPENEWTKGGASCQ